MNFQLSTVWYEALHAAKGLWLRGPDIPRLKQMLYSERVKLADPALANITINSSPVNPTGEIWLVKRRPKDQPHPQPQPTPSACGATKHVSQSQSGADAEDAA